jgi:NTE family protein
MQMRGPAQAEGFGGLHRRIAGARANDARRATADQFSALECAHEYVVYAAERGNTSWSRLCLSQADCILIVARGTDAVTAIEPFAGRGSSQIPVELILLWSANIVAGKTTAWIDALRPAGHQHVRSSIDIGRAARLLTGRGTGLVLSGGGARGLSHIGVARALSDHGISIDAICGTSIGAYIGAALAMEWDFETLRRRIEDFSRKHPLLELVVPRWSLLSGRGLRVSAEKWFGEWAIEDTPIRYACVTTNLTACGAAAHRRGKLKTWVRASCSLPGVFPPVLAENAVHIDGGLVNNLPTDIIRNMGVGFVLAVDVGAGRLGLRSIRNYVRVYCGSEEFGTRSSCLARLRWIAATVAGHRKVDLAEIAGKGRVAKGPDTRALK